MNRKLRNMDMIRVALQRKGASKEAIADLLSRLESLATSPKEFRKWNRELGEDGLKMLVHIGSESGLPFCNLLLETVLNNLCLHFDIQIKEIQDVINSLN